MKKLTVLALFTIYAPLCGVELSAKFLHSAQRDYDSALFTASSKRKNIEQKTDAEPIDYNLLIEATDTRH